MNARERYTEVQKDFDKAIRCLYLEAPPAVVLEVQKKAVAAIQAAFEYGQEAAVDSWQPKSIHEVF